MKETFKRIPYQTKKEWLKMRDSYIGGSDASSILGINNYKSSVELWKEKVKGIRKEFKSNNLVVYGTKSEASLRTLFKLAYPEYLIKHTKELLVNNDYPFMSASLDGELIEKSTGKKGVWECKTAYIANAIQKEKWENDSIPQNYFVQTLHYLLVTGWDFVVLQVELRYEIEGKRWFLRKIYKFDRDDITEDIDYLLKKEIEFWNYVETKREPPLEIPNL